MTLIRASPVSMRKDLDGEAREFRAAEECAIGVVPRRVYVCAARGEEARCSGSGEDEPEREDMKDIVARCRSLSWVAVCFCFAFRNGRVRALQLGMCRDNARMVPFMRM